MITGIVLLAAFIYFMWAPEEWGRILARAYKAFLNELDKGGAE